MGLNDDFLLEGEHAALSPEKATVTPAQMVDVEEDIKPEVVQIEEVSAKVDDLYTALESIHQAGGMSQAAALECEAIIPGFIGEHSPLNYFTKTPTATRYMKSVEEISAGIIALIAAGIAALGALIYKFFKWFSGDSGSGEGGGGGGGGSGSDSFGDGKYQTPEQAEKADRAVAEVADVVDVVNHETRAYNIDVKKIVDETVRSEPESALSKIMNSLNPVQQSILEQDEFFRMIRASVNNCKRWEEGFHMAVEKIYHAVAEYGQVLDGMTKLIGGNERVTYDEEGRITSNDGGQLFSDKLGNKLKQTKMVQFLSQFDDNNPRREEYKEKMPFFFGSSYEIMIGGKSYPAAEAGEVISQKYHELKDSEPKKYTDFKEVAVKLARLDRGNIIKDFMILADRHNETTVKFILKRLKEIEDRVVDLRPGMQVAMVLPLHTDYRDADGNFKKSKRRGSIFRDKDLAGAPAGNLVEHIHVIKNLMAELSSSIHGYMKILQVVKYVHQDGLSQLDHLAKQALKEMERAVVDALDVELKKKSATDDDKKEIEGITTRIKNAFTKIFK